MGKLGKGPWLALVGGFLGAGKTSLILAAAEELKRRGLRSAAIFNDQGQDLVDTGYAAHSELPSSEVTGGCFCCRLSDLVHEIERVEAWSPDVIFAEPVGSCTDLAATVLRPLIDRFGSNYQLAPITVLVDRARQQSIQDADPKVRYLFEKQIEEADLICMTKSDLYPKPETQPESLEEIPVRRLSARTGQGVSAWLDEIFSGRIVAGKERLEIDYEEYAMAEAALAWLNLEALVEANPPMSPALLLGPLLDKLSRSLAAGNIELMHLKALAASPTGFVKASMCAHDQEPTVEGNLDASPAGRLDLRLNLRALGEPARVTETVESILQGQPRLYVSHFDCFTPAAPVPEMRITNP